MSDQKAKLQNKNTTQSRANAAKILTLVLRDKKSLPDAIQIIGIKAEDSFAQALCYGVLRFYLKLDFFLSELTAHPLKDFEIKSLLWVGLYQLFFLNKPAYAVVTETVNATRQLKKTWATKLVNGILRSAIRNYEVLEKNALLNITCEYSHPKWLIKAIQTDHPDHWQTILNNNNQHAPMTLRLNINQQSRESYRTTLQTQAIAVTETSFSPHGICLEKPLPVNEIHGFNEGFISVQDEAAQLAVPLLMLSAGQVVLDACAAPGGKTTHMLEVMPQLKLLVAVDSDKERLKRVKENLMRIKQSVNTIHIREDQSGTVQLVCADIKTLGSQCDSDFFDRILLDVPCSATGVIRRHPDIKWLRLESDIAKLAEEQLQILKEIWPLLKSEGILLYTTCSVLSAENSDVLECFLRETADAIEMPINEEWGNAAHFGRQILPGLSSNMDGFYFCRLRKLPSGNLSEV